MPTSDPDACVRLFDRPTFARAARRAPVATLLLALVLSGCMAPGQKPGRKPADGASINAGGAVIALTPPPGFCVDPESVRPKGAAAFVLIEDCALAGEVGAIEASHAAPDVPIEQPALVDGLVTLSIGDRPLFAGGPSAEAAGFRALETFLRSDEGRASAGLGGDAANVRIVETRQVDDTLYVLVEDSGEHVVPVLGERFWRAFTSVKDRAMIASLGVFDSSSMRDGAKLAHLARVVTSLKEGNGDAPGAGELQLASTVTAPASAPSPQAKPAAPARGAPPESDDGDGEEETDAAPDAETSPIAAPIPSSALAYAPEPRPGSAGRPGAATATPTSAATKALAAAPGVPTATRADPRQSGATPPPVRPRS